MNELGILNISIIILKQTVVKVAQNSSPIPLKLSDLENWLLALAKTNLENFGMITSISNDHYNSTLAYLTSIVLKSL